MNTSKGNERNNGEGAAEINVETVDYRKLAGQKEEEEPHQEKVAVTHLIHDDNPPSFVAGAAAKVAEKLQSSKETTTKTQ
ncbi:hypothetical protein C2S52_000861 [Perilla frutescens var. hirtella]|uniref:Uncharacterized protein n=1 Tax=Perilla frutescens var. hirtella TaxID=608512 RepID=A0AAD4JD96_PERFH|nr:hypothetical protein C2S51_007542 [Perilla frutescens var. frutescens]KAH6800397.1 hypothetical protein C2S52_000861 [Perilla frutescens var. hirtella]KAH6831617.1 hypothetical protein C2S53_008816 [Perilla frutescens var. hirtella]